MDYMENVTQKEKLEYFLELFKNDKYYEYHTPEAIKLILEMLKDAKAYRYDNR